MITETTLAACTQFDPQIWSDLHKDAYGFRPRNDLSELSAEELDRLWLSTCEDLDRELEREAELKRSAVARFEELLSFTADSYGISQADAIRWLFDAEDVEFHSAELGYFLWKHGISCLQYERRLREEFFPQTH